MIQHLPVVQVTGQIKEIFGCHGKNPDDSLIQRQPNRELDQSRYEATGGAGPGLSHQEHLLLGETLPVLGVFFLKGLKFRL